MAEIVRPLLTSADPTEASQALLGAGVAVVWVGIDAETGGLRAMVPDGDEATSTTFLDGYAFTAARGEWKTPLPPAVQAAIDTLAAFYAANPTTITDAQAATLHRAEVIILRHHHRELTG